MSKHMYDIIKRQNGERFAAAIRRHNNGIFDIPGLDKIVRFAGRDAEPILKYLTSLKKIQAVKTSAHQEPLQLLAQAGYSAYVADTLEKQNAIAKYFAPGEELCTFRDKTRFERYHIINAVRFDADTIKRADFHTPERQDAYGTSVISIQVLKEGGDISIKNRYNHVVDACDDTFNSNPDNIIPGLTDAIQNYFGVDLTTTRYDLPRGYRLVGTQICKYNQEINNVYIGEDFYIADGDITAIDTQHQIMLGGGLVFDIPTKTARSVADEFCDCYGINSAFEGKKFQQTVDKKTKIRTLTANGEPIIRVQNGEMIHINIPNAEHVILKHMNKLRGVLDLGGAKSVYLGHIDTTQISQIKFNPNATGVFVVHSALPAGEYDFSNAGTLVLNNADISRVTSMKTKPDAVCIAIENIKFPNFDFDFSRVQELRLVNCDMRNAGTITFNPHGNRINLRGAKLPAQRFDMSDVGDVVLDGTDIGLCRGIKMNPDAVFGITPDVARQLIAKYKQR